ncbi:hypothetical protein EYF80_005010 [Liparis tanakae]|uniref:Uncharacterized protein n=1 Tax=Liparis tanakae TaxID=230148 RepID=A0A4Z2J3P9_9TELE|nr:hypothetical protein EYF80_005010 [Liparis tanakae]
MTVPSHQCSSWGGGELYQQKEFDVQQGVNAARPLGRERHRLTSIDLQRENRCHNNNNNNNNNNDNNNENKQEMFSNAVVVLMMQGTCTRRGSALLLQVRTLRLSLRILRGLSLCTPRDSVPLRRRHAHTPVGPLPAPLVGLSEARTPTAEPPARDAALRVIRFGHGAAEGTRTDSARMKDALRIG